MKKVISIMLTAVMLLSMTLTATVFADTATVTCNTSLGDYLNGYDGIEFSKWTNNVGGYTNSNFVLDGRAFDWSTDGDVSTATRGKKSVYMRFKVDDYANSDIASARVLIAYNGNFDNSTLNIYAFDESLWNTTTAPTVDRTTKTVQFKTPAKVDNARVALSDENISSDWTYYAAADLTDAVKAAVDAGDEYLCFVLEPNGTAYGTFYITADGNKPRLQVFTTVPAPEVELTTDKEVYTAGDDIVVTATTSNVAEGATVSYTFTVNDEAATGVGNVLTIADAAEGEYVIKVTCNDGTNNFENTITITVTESGPAITANTLTGDYLNGYDGYLFSEWTYNKGGSGTNATSFYLDGRAFTYVDSTLEGDALTAVSNLSYGKKSVYMRFKVDDYKNLNVSSARILLSYSNYLANNTMNMYVFDNDLWNETTAPTVDRTTATKIQFKTPSTGSNAHSPLTDENISSDWTYYAEVDLSDVVKGAIDNDEEYVCLLLEPNGTSRGTFYIGDGTKPRMQIFTSSNNVPTATLAVEPDQASYLTTDTVTLTATGADADQDAILTYTFYVNDVEVTEGVSDNVLTLSNLQEGNNVIKVKVADQWGDYGIATKTIYVKGAPEKTYNTIASADRKFYNTYDGRDMTTDNANHINSGNYVLSDDSGKGYYAFFVRVDISDYATSNISSARFMTSMGGGLKGKTIKIYGIDSDTWTDTTTIVPTVDRSDANVIDSVTLPSDAYTTLTGDGIGSSWTLNTSFDMTKAVKDAIAAGDTHLCFVMENTSNGYSTFGKYDGGVPQFQIVTTTNNIPTVTVKADKLKYAEGDSVVLTATGVDSDVDSSLTYKFYVDGTEAAEGVDGNKLTISNYDGLEHTVTVKCFDEWDDYGVATIQLKKNMAVSISVATSGSISTALTANYTVENLSDTDALEVSLIIAVYAPDGSLYDTVFSTQNIAKGAKVTLPVTLTPKALTDGSDFTDYTATAMIWTSKTLIPLWECVDFE